MTKPKPVVLKPLTREEFDALPSLPNSVRCRYCLQLIAEGLPFQQHHYFCEREHLAKRKASQL